MDSSALLELRRGRLGLVCPACRGRLESAAAAYGCVDCGASFPVVDGYPNLIVGERFEDASDEALLRYEESSNADLTRNYWQPLFRRLWPDRGGAPRVLSVGCGTGVDVDLLCQDGIDCVGIDCGNRTTAWSRRSRGEQLLMANGMHMPFEDNSFDAAFCGCVFPHVGVVGDTNAPAPDAEDQRLQLAREMVRVLRPGGYVITSSPNRWFPFDIFHGRAPGSYRPRFNPPSSRFLLSVGDYERLFRTAGTGPARVLPVQNYWGFIRSRRSVVGTMLGLPVRLVFWLVSQPGFSFLRGSLVNPWLVVMMQKSR